jgi:hypothetical protein
MQRRQGVDAGRIHQLVQIHPFVYLVGHLAVAGTHGDDGDIFAGPEKGAVGGAGNAGKFRFPPLIRRLAQTASRPPDRFVGAGAGPVGKKFHGYRNFIGALDTQPPVEFPVVPVGLWAPVRPVPTRPAEWRHDVSGSGADIHKNFGFAGHHVELGRSLEGAWTTVG